MPKTRGSSLPATLTSCNSSRWASRRTRKKLPRFLICVILLTAVRARASFSQRSIIRHRQFQPQYPIWESSTSIFLLSWLKGSSCRPSSLRITTQFLSTEISLRKSWWPTRIRKWCSERSLSKGITNLSPRCRLRWRARSRLNQNSPRPCKIHLYSNHDAFSYPRTFRKSLRRCCTKRNSKKARKST